MMSPQNPQSHFIIKPIDNKRVFVQAITTPIYLIPRFQQERDCYNWYSTATTIVETCFAEQAVFNKDIDGLVQEKDVTPAWSDALLALTHRYVLVHAQLFLFHNKAILHKANILLGLLFRLNLS